jgi:hypothetical protein
MLKPNSYAGHSAPIVTAALVKTQRKLCAAVGKSCPHSLDWAISYKHVMQLSSLPKLSKLPCCASNYTQENIERVHNIRAVHITRPYCSIPHMFTLFHFK